MGECDEGKMREGWVGVRGRGWVGWEAGLRGMRRRK